MKKYLLSIGFVAISSSIMAQGGTLSPYSQFGLGKIADQSIGSSRGMGGVGYAFRESNQVNSLNPASYSGVDSLTFLFDAGMSMQNTNFSENGKSKNAKTADFEYVVASFRAMKHLGIGVGILPYSNVGYDYQYTSTPIDNYQTAPSFDVNTTYTMSYAGTGGLHQIFLGAGYEPLKGLSVGFNISYLWGTFTNGITTTYSDTHVNPLAKIFAGEVASYKLDLGIQYSRNITKNDNATIGITVSPGHNLGATPECLIISGDSLKGYAGNGYSIPTQIGIGLAYKHKNIWRVGLDYDLQTWSNIPVISYISADDKHSDLGKTTSYKNRQSIKMGGEYCKNVDSRSFFDRIRYRLGFGYSSSYFNIGDNVGPREISLSAGLGIPIVNTYNTRSIVNIGFTWQNYKAANLMTENTLLLNIGLTFNERWFAKWKFE